MIRFLIEEFRRTYFGATPVVLFGQACCFAVLIYIAAIVWGVMP